MINRWRRVRDWLILAGLLLTSIFTMSMRGSPIGRGLQVRSLEIVSFFEKRITWAGQFIRVLEENEELRNDNVALNTTVSRLNVIRQENDLLREIIGFKEASPYAMVAARVISHSSFGQNNYMILDVGANDGVAVDMAVVSHKGIVGRILQVSDNYSLVLPFLHPGFRVPAQVHPSMETGMIAWSGTDPQVLDLRHISSNTGVGRGDTVVTSAFSGIFPPGHPIGTIAAHSEISGGTEQIIRVTPLVSLRKTQHVLVLTHEYPEERQELESQEIF